MVEYIDEARTAGPGPEDVKACREVLKKLHVLGIKHRDINKHNFLVRGSGDGGSAVLLDFEMAKRDVTSDELEEEFQRLEKSIQDPSLRGAVHLDSDS